MYLQYEEFKKILDTRLTVKEETYPDYCYNLLFKLINNPSKYCSKYSFVHPKDKLAVSLNRGNELKFVTSIKTVINKYLEVLGITNHIVMLNDKVEAVKEKETEDGNDVNISGSTNNKRGKKITYTVIDLNSKVSEDEDTSLTTYVIDIRLRYTPDKKELDKVFTNLINKVIEVAKEKQQQQMLLSNSDNSGSSSTTSTIKVVGVFYFVDPVSLIERKRDYCYKRIQEILESINIISTKTTLNVSFKVVFGSEFFNDILKNSDPYDELVSYLVRYKEEKSNINNNSNNKDGSDIVIPDFSSDPEIYNALLRLSNHSFNKLVSNENEYFLLRDKLFSGDGDNLQKAIYYRSIHSKDYRKNNNRK